MSIKNTTILMHGIHTQPADEKLNTETMKEPKGYPGGGDVALDGEDGWPSMPPCRSVALRLTHSENAAAVEELKEVLDILEQLPSLVKGTPAESGVTRVMAQVREQLSAILQRDILDGVIATPWAS